ncbi:hypothetical protein [uncultured Pseudomonas sp.]|uniref:hypothetical protein n=1 Tax=uncultured Pseudomonas sp. TaxID=114707 RepID=UPI0025FA9F6E|nr:hypothetical protein [uncultured Pseudomonas sp.]
MEETTLAKEDRNVPTEAALAPPKSVPTPCPAIPLPEFDSTQDGIEITRLPWGYAVTRTPRTP